MMVSERGLLFLRAREGVRLKPYLDSGGVATIGYGTTVYPNGRAVAMIDVSITPEQAESFFQIDVQRFAKLVLAELTRTPTQPQFDAMVSLAYNIGIGWRPPKPPGAKDGFRQSTVLKAFNGGNFQGAQAAFALWRKVGDKVVPGLVARRALEAQMFGESVPAPDPAPAAAAAAPWWTGLLDVILRALKMR